MPNITVLDQDTINQIAAGEVIERPSAVVKELVENSIDAGSSAITVEIKDGGTTFIRVTDNGAGIEKEDIETAFKPHTTSKIKTVEDLLHVGSLGFRGEALSSIAAVSQVELITKTKGELTGTRYIIEGGAPKNMEDIGCPEGTTFLVRNLFYNTPARRKFLKSSMTEAGYINDLMERLALSHPVVAFKFINNNQMKLNTSGNENLKDIIYHTYGRDIAAQLLPVEACAAQVTVSGLIGKPVISRGNRNYMNYFINGRYIKSTVINKAIEEAYKPYSMSRRYPFTAVHFTIDSSLIDVNVHPSKMEIRFTNSEEIYRFTYQTILTALKQREMIPSVIPGSDRSAVKKETVITAAPEPFEKNRLEKLREQILPSPSYMKETPVYQAVPDAAKVTGALSEAGLPSPSEDTGLQPGEGGAEQEQLSLFDGRLLSKESVRKHRIIGQLFKTYWLVEFEDKLYMIDQHAAHEKVLYEKMMQALKEREYGSQMIAPPVILTLSIREEEVLKEHMDILNRLGFEIEPFGGKEYSVRAVPSDMLGIAQRELLMELIDSLVEDGMLGTPEAVLERAASMSCKAAVKANHQLSYQEAEELIRSLLELKNPYHCPHGRPVIISMSKYEIEKKFKRII